MKPATHQEQIDDLVGKLKAIEKIIGRSSKDAPLKLSYIQGVLDDAKWNPLMLTTKTPAHETLY